MIKENKKTAVFSYIILSIVAFITLVTIVYCIMSSFKTNIEIMASPENLILKEFTFDNYTEIFHSSTFNVLSQNFSFGIPDGVCVYAERRSLLIARKGTIL